MINIMHKRHGVDVRLSLTIFVYIIAHGFTVAADEFNILAQLIQDRVTELEKNYQDLLDEWKNTIGGVTVDSELINSRIDLRGFVHKNLKERLDSMQAIDDKLNPVSEILSIEHNQFGYPLVRVFSLEYGLGVVPLESEPVFGGSSTITVNSDVEYVDRNNLKVKVPLGYMMTSPSIERISANEYLLVEGIKSLIIEVGTKSEANVETFITKEIQSDFTGKIAGSNVENANNLKWIHRQSLESPSSSWSPATQVYINMITKLDGVPFPATAIASPNKLMSQIGIEFNIFRILEGCFPSIFNNASTDAEKLSIIKRNIASLKYDVFGKGQSPANNTIYTVAWKHEDNLYGNQKTITGTIIQNAGNSLSGDYMNAFFTKNGLLNVVAYANASSESVNSVVSIDYTSITLTARVPFSTI